MPHPALIAAGVIGGIALGVTIYATWKDEIEAEIEAYREYRRQRRAGLVPSWVEPGEELKPRFEELGEDAKPSSEDELRRGAMSTGVDARPVHDSELRSRRQTSRSLLEQTSPESSVHSLGPAPPSAFDDTEDAKGSGGSGIDARLSRAAPVASSSFTLADRDDASDGDSDARSQSATRSGAGSWFEVSGDEDEADDVPEPPTDSLRRRASRSTTLR